MEFYVKSLSDPNFERNKLQQDNDLNMMVTQIETILFTRRSSILGKPDFGANLEDYIYTFRFNDYQIKNEVNGQITKYVPLANKYKVVIDVNFTEENTRYIMFLSITIDAKIKLSIFV